MKHVLVFHGMLVVHEMAFKKHWIGISAWIWECYYQETVVNIYKKTGV